MNLGLPYTQKDPKPDTGKQTEAPKALLGALPRIVVIYGGACLLLGGGVQACVFGISALNPKP